MKKAFFKIFLLIIAACIGTCAVCPIAGASDAVMLPHFENRTPAKVKKAGDKKTVLHVNSYNEQVEWERAQMESLREIMESDAALSYHSINLNSNQPHNQARQNDVVTDLVRSAFAETYPDLIITSGDEALEFVLDKWQFLFPKVPIVFFGVRNLDESDLYGFEEYITGVTEKEPYHETASEMLQLFPETQTIYVLNDNNVPRSIALQNEIRECAKNHNVSVGYEYSENKPLTEILDDISGFGPDTLILIGSYLLGGDAMYYSESYIQKQVAAASNGPVFCLVSSFVGNGILGGRVSGTDAYINEVSEMAIEVLAGTPPSSIPIVYDSDYLNRWQFDYETLKRFNISSSELPEGHIIINQPLALWDTNPHEFRLIIVVALLLLLIIVVLILFSRMLAKKQAEAAAASGAKTVFLAKMSHEIRTPMNAIMGMTELAIRESNLLEARNHMRTVKQSGAMLLSIINDILDFSKIESDTLKLISKDYLLSSLVQNVAGIIRMKMDDSGIQFMVHVDSQIPDMLIGDEVRIRQILLNLLGNAVKFTDKGFIALNIYGEVTDEGMVALTMEVKDSGRGIKQEDIDSLFCEYYQADCNNDYTDGVGLGLPITGRLVKAMGGNIYIDSEYGKGSTFTVTLDQKIRKNEKIAAVNNADSERILVYEHSELEPVVGFTAPNARVLVVDDVKTNLMVAKGFLLSHLIRVDLCGSGAEAIAELKSKEHDLVLMDHRMPVMDGMETTKRIRELGENDPYYADLPIIALTANAVVGVGETFLANGFNDYISKPIDIGSFSKVLEKWIPDEKKGLPSSQSAGNEPYRSELDGLKIDGLDAQKGLSLSGGGYEYYLEMLMTFSEDSTERMAEIGSCLEKGDLDMFKTHVHALKGAAASIGATKMLKMAKALEEATMSLDIEYIETNAGKYIDELGLLVDEIQKALPSLQTNETSDVKPFTYSLKKELGTLKKALDNMEFAVMNRSIDKLIKHPKTKELAAIVSKIANSILMADYEKAQELTNMMLYKV